MPTSFAITFDYLCPFARNANESVIEGLAAGETWDVTFRPFSLAQTKVEEGETDVWDREPGSDGTWGVSALQWGVAVRDLWPERFSDFHCALFAARHESGEDIGDDAVLAAVAAEAGLDANAVSAAVAGGHPLQTVADEHQALVSGWEVFGVPTFISGNEAVFVRMMDRHRPDEIGRIVELIGWTNLNEFKRTRIPR